jgi:hypothetical protein
MSSLLRPALLLALVSLAVASSLPGCSQQGEGERCDLVKNGDADCDSGLVCTPSSRLRDHSTDRCCAPNNGSSDARCDPATPPDENVAGAGGEGSEPAPGGGSGGTGGTTGGSGGNGGTGGTTAGSGGSGGAMMSTGGVPDSAGNGGQSEGGASSSDPSAGRGGA